MAGLIFDEQTMLDGNIFKFENRLHTHVNRYIENGMILTTYFSQNENSSTVDRGTQNIDELFGNNSPTRYNKILNFPLSGFGANNPENTDEKQIEDINVEGDCIILPTTIVPKQYDAFIINHLKMPALFLVTSVTYDSMKVDGFYKIHYQLISTAEETIQNINKQVVPGSISHTDLNAIGSDLNPIIKEDDYVYRNRLRQMISQMIQSYKGLYYSDRHNCFIYRDQETGYCWFDNCANEFMAKNDIMNTENSTHVVALYNKLNDSKETYLYANSIFNWVEMRAPVNLIQQFYFELIPGEYYQYSSFAGWHDDVEVIRPIQLEKTGKMNRKFSYFDNKQLDAFINPHIEPNGSEYDKLIWKFIHKQSSLNIRDVPLEISQLLLTSMSSRDVYLLTPIIIYIIRYIIGLN